MTYFDGWKVWMKRGNKSRNTMDGYIRDVEQFLMFLFGNTEDQTPYVYSTVDSDKAYEFLDKGNFGPATIGRKISSMRSFYSYLIKDKKIIKENPFDGMVRPAVPKPRPKALTETQTLNILANAYEKKYVAISDSIRTCFLRLSLRFNFNSASVRPSSSSNVSGRYA